MPSDIRSFFGGREGPCRDSAPSSNSKASKNGAPSQSKKRGRKILEDSDDEELETKPKKAESKKTRASPQKEKFKEQSTTSSDYFASSGKSKPTRSTPLRPKSSAPVNGSATNTPQSKAAKAATPSTGGRRSARKAAEKSYAESDSDQVDVVLDDEELGGDDIHATDFRSNTRRAGDDYDEEDDIPTTRKTQPKTRANGIKGKGKNNKKKKEDEDGDSDVDMAEVGGLDSSDDPVESLSKNPKSTRAGRKRKSKELDEDDISNKEDRKSTAEKKSKKSPENPPAKKPKASTKKEEKGESKAIQDIFDNIPTVRAPTPPPRDPNKKFNFAAMQNRNDTSSAAAPTDAPEGAENCLAGLTFVFTGVLSSLGREEGQNLVKQYGAKVTGAPSKNTSFVVLGSDAGPKKLETIRKLGIKTINDEGLYELIKRLPANGGDGKAAEKHAEKQKKQLDAVKAEAAEMDRLEREAAKAKAQAAKKTGAVSTPAQKDSSTKAQSGIDNLLWVDKYAPTSLGQVCGNKGLVEKLQRWLRNWHKSAHFKFKKAGGDGTGVYRAVMLHGPPGVGKTTAAHLVANLEGFDVVESNASDTRSKKLVETGLRGVLDTTSLLGYFAGDGKKVEASKRKLVLIMDEVDGMSAGDRGGVGALASVAKKTAVPMILICNERRLPKMKPFDFITGDFPFRRPTADNIRGRLMTICYREGIKIPPPVLDALIAGTHADIRQVINMVSTARLDRENMGHDEGKAMSKAWEKHIILKPWDIVGQILRPQTFAEKGALSLNEKIELYFNDHEFSYLMLQENYIKTNSTILGRYSEGRDKKLKALELADKAAESISDGDLVDRMIHGTQQQWSLMPTHAVFSFVRPASFIYGNLYERVGFAGWLGQNSKQGKLSRFVKEIQGHMRLRASGDRHEIRQQYLPLLWTKTIKTLQDEGKEAAEAVIDLMDSYFLTKDDYDAMQELGLAHMDESNLKMESSAKATFTRLYNSQSHPLPFMKASAVKAPAKVAKVKPDLEDAIEESDVGEEILSENEVKAEEDEEIDVKKDKYIKAPKKKPAAKGAGKGKKKGKQQADDEDQEDVDGQEESEEEKPKKGRGRPKGKGKK
ncbi:MAG: hypothetical protein Q9160_007801 [Pyrenula sp. 1 TL-2023]